MPKTSPIKPHLNLAELEFHYRTADDPVERSRWQIVWLLAQGKSVKEVADITGYSLEWIRKIIQRYNQAGPSGLRNRRRR